MCASVSHCTPGGNFAVMAYQNDLLLKAANKQAVPRPPVWLMRQAGRILPEYRAVRESVNGFKALVSNPELAAEVTIQPVDLLGVDAAIIFSDILVIPEALGLPYEMEERKGPTFARTLQTEQDILALQTDGVAERLKYVADAIKITKERLANRVPLIGFAGAPWTVLAYMVEGGGSKTFSKARAMLALHPALAHLALQKITDATIAYLRMQVAAGADVLQLFDSWAGQLSPDSYREFSLPYMAQICAAIPQVPITMFAKGAFFALEDMAATKASIIGIDWHTPIEFATAACGPNVVYQGNLDPAVLYGSTASIEAATRAMLEGFKGYNHIANLGHGVYPDIDPNSVRTFINTIKAFRWES